MLAQVSATLHAALISIDVISLCICLYSWFVGTWGRMVDMWMSVFLMSVVGGSFSIELQQQSNAALARTILNICSIVH
jgi:hypothetical protein